MNSKRDLSDVLSVWQQKYTESNPAKRAFGIYLISKRAQALKRRYGERAIDDLLYRLANKNQETAGQIARVHLLTWRSIKRTMQFSTRNFRYRQMEWPLAQQTERGSYADVNGEPEVFGVEHLLLIAGVVSESLQQSLLKQCSEQLWSVDRLKSEIRRKGDVSIPASTVQDGEINQILRQNIGLDGKHASILTDALTILKNCSDRNTKRSPLDIHQTEETLAELCQFLAKLQAAQILISEAIHLGKDVILKFSRNK